MNSVYTFQCTASLPPICSAMSDPHFGFILAAYAVGFVTIAAMVAAILFDQFTLKRALAKLPVRGEGEADR